MNISKAIIPVAGYGTRMLPAAKAIPKEMLPIVDRPTIQYVVEEAAAGGLRDVLLVTARNKRAIEDHFDRDGELESLLASTSREHLLDSVNVLAEKVRIHSTRQRKPKGLGDAVLQGKGFVGEEPFMVLLGDAIFSGDVLPVAQLVAAAKKFDTPVIGLEEVATDKVDRYGIVSGKQILEGVYQIDGLVEKPKAGQSASRLAIAARYILTPDIFDCLEKTKPGAGGEIQLTDAIAMLLAHRPIHGVVLNSRRHDIGNPIDWLKTNLIFARRDEQIWKQLGPLLESLK
jgi:UTP--glucose-1-phosphate uridylyltransferase